ncbi:uncharacterized protein LY89DRAFT_374286 [Mollisia scopiformis]|uniref:Protein kinase domain-containing protein n=1 Tax=Mollisia scopiformis TaxID=149040 RepID=A0A132B4Z9_MOLSC|nr:uncharacterized protein LY89DRAFT_374286 [Mollisia scopiformis]KUJ06964.1 hypothetical protein LY89DRAFT_374286 [Mollisia scopiformis]
MDWLKGGDGARHMESEKMNLQEQDTLRVHDHDQLPIPIENERTIPLNDSAYASVALRAGQDHQQSLRYFDQQNGPDVSGLGTIARPITKSPSIDDGNAGNIGDLYVQQGILGRGAYAIVKKVVHKTSGQVFARKCYIVAGPNAEYIKHQFTNEIEIMKSLPEHHHMISYVALIRRADNFPFLFSRLPILDHWQTISMTSEKEVSHLGKSD